MVNKHCYEMGGGRYNPKKKILLRNCFLKVLPLLIITLPPVKPEINGNIPLSENCFGLGALYSNN
jgi:hypothetical protein